MDPLDWALVCHLAADARMSYQFLARTLGVSSNTVKNRMNKLLEREVILGFGVMVSVEMIGAEHVAGFVATNGSEEVIDFMEQVATQPMVCEVYRTSDRRYEYWAMVTGASETLGLKRFLKNLDGVNHVEMRPQVFFFPNKPSGFFLNTRGRKVTFSRSQLLVLRCLMKDARMPVSQIAKETGFTPRRARRILRELQDGGGVVFSIGYDVFALGDMEYRLRICYDESQASGHEVLRQIYEKYPNEFWWSAIVTNEPMLELGLIIDRPGRGGLILNELKAIPFVKSVEDMVSFPRVVRGNNPLRRRLEELLIEAGL